MNSRSLFLLNRSKLFAECIFITLEGTGNSNGRAKKRFKRKRNEGKVKWRFWMLVFIEHSSHVFAKITQIHVFSFFLFGCTFLRYSFHAINTHLNKIVCVATIFNSIWNWMQVQQRCNERRKEKKLNLMRAYACFNRRTFHCWRFGKGLNKPQRTSIKKNAKRTNGKR